MAIIAVLRYITSGFQSPAVPTIDGAVDSEVRTSWMMYNRSWLVERTYMYIVLKSAKHKNKYKIRRGLVLCLARWQTMTT